MPFSTTEANNILNWMFGKTGALSAKNKVYIGYSSNDPEKDNGVFNELSGGSYSRVLISQYNETYPDVIGTASGRSIQNVKQINWNKATADWETAKGFGLFTTETGGTPYYYASLDEPYPTAETGAVSLFDPATLKITFPITDIHEAVATTTTE